MDLAAFLILFAPLILLYTYSPNLYFSPFDAPMNIIWVLITTALATLVAWVLPLILRRSRPGAPQPGLRNPWYAHGFAILLAFLFASLVEAFDWIETFATLFFPPETFLVADLLLLLPFLIPYLVFRTHLSHRTLVLRGRPSTLMEALNGQVRGLIVILGPQLLYLNIYAFLVHSFEPTARIVEAHPWLNFAIVGLLIFLLLTYSPYFVRLLYTRIPLEDHPAIYTYQTVFADLSKRTGIPLNRVSIWMTGSAAVANAAVSGAFGRQRTVFITDRLLEILNPEEVQAVVAHELGHAYHRHLLFMLPVALLSSVFVVWTLYLLELFVDTGDALGAAVMLIQFGYLLAIYRPISQRFEYQSDAYAAHVTGSPVPLANALLKLAQDHGANRKAASLTHPAITQRIKRLADLHEAHSGDLTAVVRKSVWTNRLLVAGMTVVIVLTLVLGPSAG